MIRHILQIATILGILGYGCWAHADQVSRVYSADGVFTIVPSEGWSSQPALADIMRRQVMEELLIVLVGPTAPSGGQSNVFVTKSSDVSALSLET